MSIDPKQVQKIFLAILDGGDTEQREVVLNRECGENLLLRQRVEALLKAHDSPLELPSAGRGDSNPTVGLDSIASGTVISNRYKLQEEIATGGMGTVWVAQQLEPIRRRVAIKLIKPGMDSRQVLARFEVERQALALMDHPNIAKVLDGGMTDQGRPYFAMEYVKGVPITEYCDRAKLSVRDRLLLFTQVCQAVQHAHQKGVIHRDLKPSNILVCLYDGKPVPKVIDFGLAKAVHQPLSENTLFTAHGMMVGTPLYMSPEQAEFNNLDIDTRTDVYSLGVILYELLTGSTPLEKQQLKNAAWQEVLNLIKEYEPSKPSTKISGSASLESLAAQRGLEPAQLSRSIRGDLDWIVMKTLEKERSRRYETANGLVRDIERYLNNQPVEASPPSMVYRFRKFATRNRSAISISALVLMTLLAGMIVSITQAVRATRAERAIAATLEELQATAPAFAAQARALASTEKFSEAIEKLDYALKLKPKSVEYLTAKANLLQCQFKFDEAIELYRQTLRLKPDLEDAQESASLCEELLSNKRIAQGEFSRESYSKLHLLMQKQQRPAYEMMPIARQLGEEKTHQVAYWSERLKDLPISAERPIRERIAVREDGLLAVDLSETKIINLEPLVQAPIGTLNLAGCNQILDFSPLSQIRSLTSLDVSRTAIVSLEPVRGHRLTDLALEMTMVEDLSPLIGMKIEMLNLRQTRVSSLSPLAGMPIRRIDATSIPALDYVFLQGAPHERIVIQNSALNDLSFLRNSPVEELILFGCNSVRGFAVLSELRALKLLVLPSNFQDLPDHEREAIEALRSHPTLRNIEETLSMGGRKIQTTQSKEVFWQKWDREKAMFQSLRQSGYSFLHTKLPNGMYRIHVEHQALRDLSLFKDMPISELYIAGTEVSDLEPIRGMALTGLHLYGTKVTDLGPLKGMPLEFLNIVNTKIGNVDALRGMPLVSLRMNECSDLSDLTPLQGMFTLRELTLPLRANKIEFLRQFPNMQRIGYVELAEDSYRPNMNVNDFWNVWERTEWVRTLNDRGAMIEVGLEKGEIAVRVFSRDFHDLSQFRGRDIGHLQLDGTVVTDLEPLEGLELKSISLNDIPVRDISSLGRGTLAQTLEKVSLRGSYAVDFSALNACGKLEVLDVFFAPDFDLAEFKGNKLRILNIGGTSTKEIGVVSNMPLEEIYMEQIHVEDISPLLQCEMLKKVVLPKSAKNISALRALRKLERISFRSGDAGPMQSTAEFWQEQTAFGNESVSTKIENR